VSKTEQAIAILDDQDLPIGFTTDGLSAMNDATLIRVAHRCILDAGRNIGALALVFAEATKRGKVALFKREFPYLDTTRLDQIAKNLIHAAFFAAPQPLVNIILNLPMAEQRRIVDGTVTMVEPEKPAPAQRQAGPAPAAPAKPKAPAVKPVTPAALVDPAIREQVIGRKPDGKAFIRTTDEQLRVREHQQAAAREHEKQRKESEAIAKKKEEEWRIAKAKEIADQREKERAEALKKKLAATKKDYHFDGLTLCLEPKSDGYRIPIGDWVRMARECISYQEPSAKKADLLALMGEIERALCKA